MAPHEPSVCVYTDLNLKLTVQIKSDPFHFTQQLHHGLLQVAVRYEQRQEPWSGWLKLTVPSNLNLELSSLPNRF